jgi:hypothetical protein
MANQEGGRARMETQAGREMESGAKPPLPAYFWVAVVATALIAAGASMDWVSAGGIAFGGQSLFVDAVAPVDSALVYVMVVVSAIGLSLYVVSRNVGALIFCAAAALGTGAILAVDLAELLGDEFSIAFGAYLTGGSALALLLASFAHLVGRGHESS